MADSSTCTANHCFSNGDIGNGNGNDGAGGIFGANCNNFSPNCTCEAFACYSTGTIFGSLNGSNGGIFGSNAAATCIATNCYSTGNIGQGSGGIFADGASGDTAILCYNSGQVIGPDGGGIYGQDASNGSIASYCYSTGAFSISPSPFYPYSTGSIFGSGSDGTCTCDHCYAPCTGR